MHVRPNQKRWREVTDLLPYMCTQASQELTTPSAHAHSLLPPTPLQLHSLHPFILPAHPTPTSPKHLLPPLHFSHPSLPTSLPLHPSHTPSHSHFTQATRHPTPTSPKPHAIPLPPQSSHTPAAVFFTVQTALGLAGSSDTAISVTSRP